jgi:NAD binding domain of 6-phosphogluconate dehydrogenase
VALGPDGVVSGLRRGGVFIDMSTIAPDASRAVAQEFAEAGAVMLDAPLSGSPVTVYFPTGGLVSLLAIMQTGDVIETAVIGREGVVGGLVGSQGARSFGQTMVQIEGSALRLGAGHFMKQLEVSNGLRSLVNSYQSVVFLQAQQSAACHAFHSIEARLCRWLL